MKNSSYERYYKEKVMCPYCDSLTNLYVIKQHMNGTRCQDMKKKYFTVHKDKSEEEIDLYLNSLRKKILYKEEISDDM